MISSVNSTAMSVDDDEQDMKQTKYFLDVPLSAMNNSKTSQKNSVRNVFSTSNRVSFFVEVKDQQYFDHLQLHEILSKLIPCRTCLLLFEKQNAKGICKLYMILVANTDTDELMMLQLLGF